MTQVGEPVHVGVVQPKPIKNIFVAVTEIRFESGIQVFDVEAGGAEKELPPAGDPHWGRAKIYPAVYVRQGGAGETKALKVKVEWLQKGFDGSAKLTGKSSDGTVVIEGDFSVSGPSGTAMASCTFTKKPDTVANHGKGLGFTWTADVSGATVQATGGSTLKLFFVDAKPKPIGWSYKKHYLQVIDWATSWAAGQQGDTKVLAAIWDKFSDGKAARVPHATGFAYWKTGEPVQDLKTLVQPDGDAKKKGWSCRAIAHTFMECLALHGIKCLEVIPETALGTHLFLVHNWDVRATPVPNWEASPDLYYAGSWISSSLPPLNKAATTSLMQEVKGVKTKRPIVIDMKKRSGVPAQGQPFAPLGFSNHWIVEVNGMLYDSSYGVIHANNMTAYAKDSLAGWLIDGLADAPPGRPSSWLTSGSEATAWRTHAIAKHTLLRSDASHN